MSKQPSESRGFIAVLRRELYRIIERRLYLGVCIGLPLFTLFFMVTVFGNGQMNNLPIGVVDLDWSNSSRQLSRMISAVPTLKVSKMYHNEPDARDAVEKKKIYGYMVIPHKFEKNLYANNATTISYYYHYALLSVGAQIHEAFEETLGFFSASPFVETANAMGIDVSSVENIILPVKGNFHPLYNPNLDYSIYLTQFFFYILFQVLILLVTVYVLGIEMKFKTAIEWLECGNNNIAIAVFAKLMPYTVIFTIIGIFANYVIFGICHIPHQCSMLSINLLTPLFVLATQALALFLFSLFPAISIIISVVSMIASLGATLAGVTFPISSMFAPIRLLSFFFPVRHFVEVNQKYIYSNSDFSYSWANIAILFIFLIPPILMLPRLKRSIQSLWYERI